MIFSDFSHIFAYEFYHIFSYEHMSFCAFSHVWGYEFRQIFSYEHMSFCDFSHVWEYELKNIFSCKPHVFHENLIHFFLIISHMSCMSAKTSYETHMSLHENSLKTHVSFIWVACESLWELIMRHFCTGGFSGLNDVKSIILHTEIRFSLLIEIFCCLFGF